ncbi:MAG: ATP-binding protein [Bacteroidetes bacterium]|nr:ATP-binding protein [Bacteroidota bacterium]
MKITGIHINDYQQFNDFHLDLTYPKGHEKEGKPLEKVCFIGQSGTGKTTIIKVLVNLIKSRRIIIGNEELKDAIISYRVKIAYKNVFSEVGKFSKRNEYDLDYFEVRDNDAIYREEHDRYIKDWKTILIYFPSELQEIQDQSKAKTEKSFFEKLVQDTDESRKKISDEIVNLKEKKFYDFSVDNTQTIWKSILIDAKDYMVNELSYSQKISKALVKNSDKADELLKEFKNWQKKNPSPFKDLAKVLNPIIQRFNIKVKEDFDFERAEDLEFIKLETLNQSSVPFNFWSTGTKQVVLTAIPIHKLDTNKTIILIDEPERSLYPDIQQEIIDYYTQLAPNAQFFFATHSPIIASSFEPWEIIELKFNYEKGKVYQEKYFEGERDVKNYFINPQYLRWDSILTKVFDLKERGNEKRIEKLMELAAIGKRIEKEPDKKKKAEIYKEYKKLSELLDWETK